MKSIQIVKKTNLPNNSWQVGNSSYDLNLLNTHVTVDKGKHYKTFTFENIPWERESEEEFVILGGNKVLRKVEYEALKSLEAEEVLDFGRITGRGEYEMWVIYYKS